MNFDFIRYAYQECLNDLSKLLKNCRIQLREGTFHDFPNKRDVAFTMFSGDKRDFILVFAPKYHYVRPDMYVAVMRHEFAHVIDEHLSDLEKARLFGVKILKLPCERRVDRMAEIIWKQPIYYDKKYLIQNLLGGIRPRPSHLPK